MIIDELGLALRLCSWNALLSAVMTERIFAKLASELSMYKTVVSDVRVAFSVDYCSSAFTVQCSESRPYGV
jgi:hypothetical protein